MRKALYTINFDGYDKLHEPLVITPGWDYICFTDNPSLKSQVFEIRGVQSLYKGHLVAREYYINSQKYLPDYDLTIMIGGQIQVNCDLDKFIKKYCDLGCDFNMMEHCRNCTYKEAKENKKFFGDAGKKMIEKQMVKYANDGLPADFGLFAHGIIVRRKSKEIAEHERLWWKEVKNPDYVTRDQLSFMYVLWKYSLVTVNGFGDYWDILHSDFLIYKHGTDRRL